MYHRIASADRDPWKLCVSPLHFEEQLQVLSKHKVLALPDLVNKWKSNELPRRSIAITFDDGYIDNYTVAKPLLEKYALPATFFITTNNIGRSIEFWWDELEQMALKGQQDIDTYMKIWEQLLPLSHEQQQSALARLRNAAGIERKTRAAYTCMSIAQLQEMAANKLFSIGAHTLHHVALGYQLPEVQKEEITGSRTWLKELTGSMPALLAYPYGSYDVTTTHIASEEKFDAAFTAEEKPVTKRSARYELGRFKIDDWSGNEFERKLKSWLSQ